MLKIQVLMLKYLPNCGEFDQKPLEEFYAKGYEIVKASHKFLTMEGLPCCVVYFTGFTQYYNHLRYNKLRIFKKIHCCFL
jgi:hypothetical protein